MASPMTGFDKYGHMKITEQIIARFSKTGARAGAAKCPKTFKIPIHKATKPIKKMYGNIIRVRVMVSGILPGESKNPGAIIFTISGASKMPKMESTTSRMDITNRADRARRRPSSCPSSAR
jgi:hypothetical protein